MTVFFLKSTTDLVIPYEIDIVYHGGRPYFWGGSYDGFKNVLGEALPTDVEDTMLDPGLWGAVYDALTFCYDPGGG